MNGAGDRTRTGTVLLPRDFRTTLCRHSQLIAVVVWTLSLPYVQSAHLGSWCIASTHQFLGFFITTSISIS